MRAYRMAFAAPLFWLSLIGAAAAGPAALSGEEAIPAPVVGWQLFGPQVTGNADCASNVSVITELKADQVKLGGQTFVLTGGVEQAFADTWRRHVHVASVPVSMIVAHIFSNPINADPIVDTVEFDAQGCAMSRTLLPAAEWSFLLHDAVGEQA